MITYLIILFFFLILVNFLYEGAIAPSLRLMLKYELFKIRDQLRCIKDTKESGFSEEIYLHLQSSLNNLIRFLPTINILSIAKAEKTCNEDEALRQDIQKITRMFEDCKSENVQKMRSKIRKVFILATVVNNGMLLMYSLPIFVLSVFAKEFVKGLFTAFQNLLYIPENEFGRVVHVRSKIVASC
jgi:hypothetical protein